MNNRTPAPFRYLNGFLSTNVTVRPTIQRQKRYTFGIFTPRRPILPTLSISKCFSEIVSTMPKPEDTTNNGLTTPKLYASTYFSLAYFTAISQKTPGYSVTAPPQAIASHSREDGTGTNTIIEDDLRRPRCRR